MKNLKVAVTHSYMFVSTENRKEIEGKNALVSQ